VCVEYVTTRWYRAPEILVGWQNYSYAIDNWAVGKTRQVIMKKEILTVYVRTIGTIVAELIGRKPLFIGKDTVEQLDTIFAVLGKPPDTFINACKKPEIRHYVRYVNVETITPLSVVYPRASRTAIDLISSLLVFDPTLRMTAKHALRHPFVAKFNRGFPNPHCPLPVVEFMFDSTVPSIEQLRDEILFEGDAAVIFTFI
jgi:mitogen-activated protein kinase 7